MERSLWNSNDVHILLQSRSQLEIETQPLCFSDGALSAASDVLLDWK